MYKRNDALTCSASDLVGFLECPHRTTLDLIDLDTPLERAKADEQVELIQDKGFAHEAGYLDSLRARGGKLVELSSKGNFAENIAATRAAMASGADIIFQAAFANGSFMGYADFLISRRDAFDSWRLELRGGRYQAGPPGQAQIHDPAGALLRTGRLCAGDAAAADASGVRQSDRARLSRR